MNDICCKLKDYKKALVLGTGGGNDIVSATLIADYLISCGMQCGCCRDIKFRCCT